MGGAIGTPLISIVKGVARVYIVARGMEARRVDMMEWEKCIGWVVDSMAESGMHVSYR